MAIASDRGKVNPYVQNNRNPKRSNNGRGRVSTSKRKNENPIANKLAKRNFRELPWIENRFKGKGNFHYNGEKLTTTPSGHTIKSNSSHSNYKHAITTAENARSAGKLEVAVNQLSDGKPVVKDPATLTLSDRLDYNPITGKRYALDEVAVGLQTTPEEFISKDTEKQIKNIEDSYSRGLDMERGMLSFGKDDAYFKQLNKKNYYNELLYNPETQKYEWVPVLKSNAEMPAFTGSYRLLGDYYETWTYEKKGNLYLKAGAPKMPYEFDEEGNVTKRNYDYYVVKEDGSWETYSYTDADIQKMKDDWAIYCALTNASSLEARQLTEKMRYTAGWNPDETDSFLDIGRDTLADASVRDYTEYSKGNRQGMRSMVGPHTASHLFKNIGGYLKTYLFTPIAKGDTQTAVLNGLVNLAETCDYAGVGSRAFFAPQLGIEYDKDDTRWERVAKAYTTHENYEPDTGSAGKDLALWVFTDPSIYLTLGGIGAAKVSARIAAHQAMKPLTQRLIKYGDVPLKQFDTPLKREYKSIARDIAFADNLTLEKHAARVAEILKETKYYTNEHALASEIIQDLRTIQNSKNFLIVKSLAGASEFVNGIDTFFLKGGLYLPYAALKTIKGTRSILRSNSWIAKKITFRDLSRWEAAANIYKNYSGGGSILDFHNIIEGFKSFRSLDASESLKAETLQKFRKKPLEQQRMLNDAIKRLKTSNGSITQRVGLLNEEISRIFINSSTGKGCKTLDELEEELVKISGKTNGVNEDSSDIIANMLKAVRDAKSEIELAEKNDAQAWLNAMYSASSSKELRELYVEYLSANNAHAISQIEDVAIERYKRLFAEEHNIDKDLVEVPDDMTLINATRANGLDSVPGTKSTVQNSTVHSDLVAIPRFVGDAHEAIKEDIKNVQGFLDIFVKKDAEGNLIRGKNGAVQFEVYDYYVADLYEYIGHVSGTDLSKLELNEVIRKTGKALNSIRGRFGGDLSLLVKDFNSVDNLFVYSGGIELMEKLNKLGAFDYYELVRTVDTPISYVPSKKLRGVRLEFQKNKLSEEGYRTAKRIDIADPNGIIQKKLRLRHELKGAKITKEDGTVVRAWDEYSKMVREYNDWLEASSKFDGLLGSLDIAFNDMADTLALTEAQAEKIIEINMAASTFLSKTMASPVIMDAIRHFDPEGNYGFLIQYKNEIADFLKQNIEVGRETPYIEKFLSDIDAIDTWRTSLNAYHNFNETLDRLELGPREMAAVLEYCLGKNPAHLLEMSRRPGYFFTNVENDLNRIMGADNLLIDGYRESVLRTSFIDKSIWSTKHFDQVLACEEELVKISKSDVKLQILQAIEMNPEAIKRFNGLAKNQDVWFTKAVTESTDPGSPVVRIEMQKWVPIDEDISLPDLLKVLEDNNKEYSHLFEVSEKFTEEDAIKDIVRIFDADSKVNPFIVTHGRDVFDIDVLRQCCQRYGIISPSLFNATNRINTFKELMLKNRNPNCIDPDKVSKIAEALSKLSRDLPQDAAFGIFNISKFSKDLDSLFHTLYDPALIKEVTTVYDCEHPFAKALLEDQEEIKAMRIDDYDEAARVRDVSEKLELLRAEVEKNEDLLKNFEEVYDPVEEKIREKTWDYENSPNFSDEEKEAIIARIPETVRRYFKDDLSQIIPKFYGTLDHVTAGFESIKNAVSEIFEVNKEVYERLLSGEKSYEFSGGKFRDFYDGTYKHIVNLKKITKELDNTIIPGTTTNLRSLLSNSLVKDIDSFVNKELDDFGWRLKNDFSNESSLVNNMDACTYFEYSLDELLSRMKVEFDNVKIEGFELGDIIPKLPEKPVSFKKPSPWFNSLYQSYHPSALIKEQTKIEILPNTYSLKKELEDFIDPFVLISNSKRFGIDPFAGKLNEFSYLNSLLEKYALNTEIPEAITNNLTVFAKSAEDIMHYTPAEVRKFVGLLNEFRADISDMLTMLVKPDTGFDIAGHVETTFSNFNHKSALLQQRLLALQYSVTNRTFKEALKVTEASPFIRDVFSPALDKMQAPTAGMVCDSVRSEVKNLNRIRSSQVNSCLTSEEFEGYTELWSTYDLPMGTSAELRFNASGDAFRVRKGYDIENASRFFDIHQTRIGNEFLETASKPEIIEDCYNLMEEIRLLNEELSDVDSRISLNRVNNYTSRVKDLTKEKEKILEKYDPEDFLTPEEYKEALEYAKTNKYKRKIMAQQAAADRLQKIDKELSDIALHNELVARKQEPIDRLLQNYEWLKKSRKEDNDTVFITKNNEDELFNDINHLIKTSDATVRVPVELHNIPAHELLSLNKFANKIKNTLDFKLKSNTFISGIATLEDLNYIINMTKGHALALKDSDPYHYLVYLKEAASIDEAFVIVDMLYNDFYKHLDSIKTTGMKNVQDGLIYVPHAYKDIVSNVMESGFDSVKFGIDNPELLKLLEGDGLDLIYKGYPKSYFDSVYYKSKIDNKHAASANISSILEKQNIREGWAKKFADTGSTIREEAFKDLEASQIELLELLKEVSDTPYEASLREYLDNLQNGLYKAQTLQVMDFITKDVDHLITELLYHNHHLVVPLRYSDDFKEYGTLLKKLEDILDENPMYINHKKHDDFLWISLDRDASPQVLNDTKYVKGDTQYKLGEKVYDSTELNEYYRHIDTPDFIELTDSMLKDVESEKVLKTYCERVNNYIKTCYKKLDFLTDGAIKGSAISPYSLMKHKSLRRSAPTDWLANAIRTNGTCDQRLFHTSQFDFSILGENEFRYKLGGQYDDTDILQNIKYCYDDLVGTVSTERMYIANFFDENSHCKLNNVFGPEISDADKVAILKNNPDQVVLTLVADKNTMTGFSVKRMRITDELSIRQADAAHAIIADYETYVEMTRLINTSEFDKVYLKAWARIVFLLKVGHLCNPGTWLRNWMDATIKATGETGNIGRTAIDQLHAMKNLFDYNKIVKDVRDNYGVHHLTSSMLDNNWAAIQARTHTKMTRQQFDFLEDWLSVSLSGGESRMLKEMLRKQKYDPWRSGNLKPGNSFTYAGREAMQNEFDYIGSDIFRFEQMGEDEINRLIEEGYRKGENIFVDDFSAEEFWQIFNARKNPKTAYIENTDAFNKYQKTAQNILTIRNKNLFRENRGLGSRLDYMCSCFLKPMSMVEQVVRLGQFMSLEKQGYTRSEIFRSIADTQFEYELKSSRIKGAELIITYFNFEYNNLRYWCTMLEEKPEYLYILENLWEGLSWEAAENYYQSEDIYNNKSIAYMMANGAIPIGSSGLYLKTFPSALGALNWFYAMPSQYMTSVVPPLEFLGKEMVYRMGGDYAEWLSNLDYSYADQEAWEKALAMVPIAGTLYTRYWQHNTERQPWKRLDDTSFGQWLVKCNPTVWGAIYQYNKPHKQDFDAWQAELAKQGKWYDSNLDKVVDIKYKNEHGLNDPDLYASDNDFDRLCAMKKLYRNEVWDSNWGGFVKQGQWETPGKIYFDEKGKPKELGLNRYRDIRIPGEWEKLCDEQFKYHGRKWDRNTDKFIPFWLWKNEKLNREDLSFSELCEYMAEKGRYWDYEDHKFKSVPENMHSYNQGYYHRGWREFRRWVNYGNNPPARRNNYKQRRYNPSTTYNVSGRPYGYAYSFHDDQAALRMATSGYKAYDEYYNYEFQYNYQYRMSNPLNQMRRYNPILRYHIIPK